MGVLNLIVQLLREWPPGYGGIERVAHELATLWKGTVYSLDAQPDLRLSTDPLTVSYRRVRLSSISFGRVILPLPKREFFHLFFSQEPLHAHLPCPGVLLVVLLTRLLRPHRDVTLHWHAFLRTDRSLEGFLIATYQLFALAIAARAKRIFTTSPVLATELIRSGCRPSRVSILPCCLDSSLERQALALPLRKPLSHGQLNIIFIGRLDSYKRVDWLINSLSALDTPWQLDVVGEGPNRQRLEELAEDKPVFFWGRLSESRKIERLSVANVLVLPSDRCNEAFGIVQLEAMASGIPSIAFEIHRSGMAWVSQLPALPWSQQPADLASLLSRIANHPELQTLISKQARKRYRELFAREIWERRLLEIS